MQKKKALILVLVCCFPFLMFAQTGGKTALKTPTKVLDDFMDLRFGMFIHFGPVTLRGTEIGWSRNDQVAQDDYDSLYKSFDPVLFDADAWVKTAKDAGMKYLTITAKHHDGFCLWPTAYSDYNISNTPFKKDIVGALANACKKYDIRFCIYFTVLDWHDPEYPIHNPHKPVIDSTADITKFVTRMKNELTELVTTYHPYMLWFDGNWEEPWKQSYAEDVYAMLKKLDPNVIVNNRLGKGDHTLLSAESVGDFNTPEQVIGAMDMDHPWETCMTLCTQWAWKPNDQMKSLKTCIENLARSAGGNGNLLFNVGPMLDGRIEARQIKRLAEMGNWLKVNGRSIYSTKGGPYPPNANYASTRKGKEIFIHVFNKASTVLTLPALKGIKIESVSWLSSTAGQKVALGFEQRQEDGAIHIQLPNELSDPNDAVIVLKLNKSSEDIAVIPNAEKK